MYDDRNSEIGFFNSVYTKLSYCALYTSIQWTISLSWFNNFPFLTIVLSLSLFSPVPSFTMFEPPGWLGVRAGRGGEGWGVVKTFLMFN